VIHAVAPFIGGMFAVSALGKIPRPRDFRSAIAGYRLVPRAFLPAVAASIITLEATLAVLLFVPPLQRMGLLAAASLLSVFALAGALTLLRGITTRCGCSLAGDGSLTWWVPLRALFLTAAASFGAAAPAGGNPLAGGIAGVLALGGVLAVVAAADTWQRARPHLSPPSAPEEAR
jgi:hypothetical protein